MRQLRILLVNVGHRGKLNAPVTPPLGIMHLASYIRSRFDVRIMLIDQKLRNLPDHKLVRTAMDFQADVIGLSAITTTSRNLQGLTEKLRGALPRALIVIGGPHVSAFREKALASTSAHLAVEGEGEIALEMILRACLEAGSFDDIPGIYQRTSEGRITKNSGFLPYIEDLDSLPPPAYDLIDLTDYWRRQSMAPILRRKYATLFSSRGCPYKCIYCHRIFGDRMRTHSADRIVDEMTFLQKRYGVNDFEFIDDIFNQDRKRLIDFCERIHQKGLRAKIAFPNGVRTDILKTSEIEALVSAGLYYCGFPLESGSPRIQQLIQKNLDIERYVRNVETAVSKKVFSYGFAMLGFPSETKEELEQTIETICRTNLHMAIFTFATPFPNTRLYDMAMEAKPEKMKNIQYTFFTELSVNLSTVEDTHLLHMQKLANRKFYFNPKRIRHIVTGYPHPLLLPLHLPGFIDRVSNGFLHAKP